MKTTYYISAFLSILILIGCGQKRSAQQLIGKFLDENLVDNQISNKNFSEIDSTFYITDHIIGTMRKQVEKERIVKPNIEYGKQEKNRKLLFMSVSYLNSNGSKQKLTFYMNSELKNIVAFKQDAILLFIAKMFICLYLLHRTDKHQQ